MDPTWFQIKHPGSSIISLVRHDAWKPSTQHAKMLSTSCWKLLDRRAALLTTYAPWQGNRADVMWQWTAPKLGRQWMHADLRRSVQTRIIYTWTWGLGQQWLWLECWNDISVSRDEVVSAFCFPVHASSFRLILTASKHVHSLRSKTIDLCKKVLTGCRCRLRCWHCYCKHPWVQQLNACNTCRYQSVPNVVKN